MSRQFSRKKNSLSDKWYGNNWISTSKRMTLDPYITLHTKINPKWIEDLNVRAKTIKLLEEKIRINLHDLG